LAEGAFAASTPESAAKSIRRSDCRQCGHGFGGGSNGKRGQAKRRLDPTLPEPCLGRKKSSPDVGTAPTVEGKDQHWFGQASAGADRSTYAGNNCGARCRHWCSQAPAGAHIQKTARTSGRHLLWRVKTITGSAKYQLALFSQRTPATPAGARCRHWCSQAPAGADSPTTPVH
jgi:hypothetical protein